jgi:disulfide bond formation protein DsbB
MWGGTAGDFNPARRAARPLPSPPYAALAGLRCRAIYTRMMVSTRVFAGFVLIASAAVLGAALSSQYWGGLVPCELCVLQRWPWAVAITISIIALFVGHRPTLPWIALVLALVFVVSSGFALYHLGVEQRWFAGPSACTATAGAATTLEDMRARILSAPLVRCDEVQWSLYGVSLAGWNLLASFAMAAVCAAMFWYSRPARPGERVGRGAV